MFRRRLRDVGEGSVRIDGFHALKHAIRFDAPGLMAVTRERTAAATLAGELAPDVVSWFTDQLIEVGDEIDAMTDRPVPTGVVAVADRLRAADGWAAIHADRSGPVVVLENPRHLGNLGAAVRVAAAAGAVGVVSTGTADPWHPLAVSGSAGLHFALPVVRAAGIEELVALGRRIVLLDPDGPTLAPRAVPIDAVLVFGTERGGVSALAVEVADAVASLPMRAGVSSLNLATTVAATLYVLGARR